MDEAAPQQGATRPQPVAASDRSDRELVVAASAGDRASLAILYDRHAGIVQAVVRRILGDQAESEDLAHDVFVEVWQRAGQYDGSRASVRGWILMIARSRALDRRRSAGRARRAPLPEAFPDGAPGTIPTGDRGRLDRALSGLPSAQREVIVLAYFDGLSSSEMAERLGVPPGTVKSRTAAAFQKLRAALGVDEGTVGGSP